MCRLLWRFFSVSVQDELHHRPTCVCNSTFLYLLYNNNVCWCCSYNILYIYCSVQIPLHFVPVFSSPFFRLTTTQSTWDCRSIPPKILTMHTQTAAAVKGQDMLLHQSYSITGDHMQISDVHLHRNVTTHHSDADCDGLWLVHLCTLCLFLCI